MTPEQIQTEALKIICSRFMRLKESTPRKGLVVRFQNPDAITDLVRRGMVRPSGQMGEEQYLPNSASFGFCGDEDLARIAKGSAASALHTLKNMYEVEPERTQFTFEDLLNHARKIYDIVDEDSLRRGLYLSQDFGIFNWYGSTQDLTEITNFQISESIIGMAGPEARWAEMMRKTAERAPTPASPALTFQGLAEATIPGAEKRYEGDFEWNLVHPEIHKVAHSRFTSGHFADAVEAALKAVNERLREVYRAERGEERDGADLMFKTFSPNDPVLLLGDLSTRSGQDMQEGYMLIFAGSMRGIRNPKAHSNITIDAVRATHFLFLASLLMFKVDEATGTRPASEPPSIEN